jgi:hypothetical protein
MRRVILFTTGLLIAVLSGCSNYVIPAPDCPEGTIGVSYSGDIQPIFNSNCITCHSGAQAPDLREGWSYDELTDGGYVEEPEFACESRLYQVFFGSHDGRASDEEILQILGWIQEGAQDN